MRTVRAAGLTSVPQRNKTFTVTGSSAVGHPISPYNTGEHSMIQRRTLLQSGAAVAFGAPALVGFAQQTVTLKFHTCLLYTSPSPRD